MRTHNIGRWVAILGLATTVAWPFPISIVQAQGGGGPGAGSSGGSDTGTGSTHSPGGGMKSMPRSKNPEGALRNPEMPGMSSQQRDRGQRLEQQLREGQINPTTPQTEMSDRLEQLHKNQAGGQSGAPESGK
jgi:hypothetical protein